MKSKFALLLATAALLASCGGNSSPAATSHPTGLSTPEASSAPQSDYYLSWIANGKLVVDLITTAEARFSYGNAALPSNSNTVDLNDSSSFACTTQMEGMNFNFVFVEETETEHYVGVFQAIEGNQLSEFCQLHKDDFKGKTRGYIAISGGDTVQWDQGKNANLDAKIRSYIQAAK